MDAATISPLTSSKAFGGAAEPLGFDFKIVDATTPYVILILHPRKLICGETGSLVMKDSEITMDIGFGNGDKHQGLTRALMSGLKRKWTGERFLTQKFQNESYEDNHTLVLAAPHPGQIVAIDLHEHDGTIYCQRGAFMAGPSMTEVSVHIRQNLGFAFLGGEEWVMQKVTGDDCVIINAGGGIFARDLKDNQTIQIDTGCLLATEKTVKTGIEKAGSWKSMFLGEEGLVFANCTGPGRVWMQSKPFSQEVAAITAEQNRQRGKKSGPVSASPK